MLGEIMDIDIGQGYGWQEYFVVVILDSCCC